MTSGVEVWVLLGLSALQFAVGYWWYRGPSIPRTRVWGAGLLLLNGSATLISGVLLLFDLPPNSPGRAVGALLDRWSDLFLLGLAVTALESSTWGRRAGRLAIAVAGTSLIVITPSYFAGGEPAHATAFELLREVPIFLAVIMTGPATIAVAARAGAPQAWPWLLVTAALMMRYAEVSTLHLAGRLLAKTADRDAWLLTNHIFALAAFSSIVLAFGRLAWLRYRADEALARTQLGFLSGLVLAGFLFGAAQRGSPVLPPTMVLFSLALIRPLGFLAAQSRLADQGFMGTGRWRSVVAVGTLFVMALLGMILAGSAWGLTPQGTVLVGGSFALLATPLAVALLRVLEARRTIGSVESSTQAIPLENPHPVPMHVSPRWSLQPDRVSLPSEWEKLVDDAFAQYQRLIPSTAQRLAEMPRWQRLILALDAIPDGGPPFPYEASTPGLHLTTHCPYASIGPEISRANDRYKAILDEFGLDGSAQLAQGSRGFVWDTFGKAEGLRSGRVKIYGLTPLGRLLAARLRANLGFERVPPADVARLVGEGFGRIPASTPPTSDPR